ncbi:unnamed protein product [Strongylus vulgaris]|uniref:MSP domain-containing protein n=1 Tax=Strongylus vulgaris TaxID=40348 RepID=A0A3P7J2E0_STRVU|nr:unnamed protein product [Strongylus vulgaris]
MNLRPVPGVAQLSQIYSSVIIRIICFTELVYITRRDVILWLKLPLLPQFQENDAFGRGRGMDDGDSNRLPVFLSVSEIEFPVSERSPRRVITVYNPYGYSIQYKGICERRIIVSRHRILTHTTKQLPQNGPFRVIYKGFKQLCFLFYIE